MTNVFKDYHLRMSFDSVQIPAGADSPGGTPDYSMYIIFSNSMTLKAGTAP
jgi:hypothetical protein